MRPLNWQSMMHIDLNFQNDCLSLFLFEKADRAHRVRSKVWKDHNPLGYS